MRQRKLDHPLWTHIPTVAMLGYIFYRFASAMPLPGSVPVQFGVSGPSRWGSPWELVSAFVGLGVLCLGISMLADELWARQETRKTFNWLSLFDDAAIGLLAAIIAGYGDFRHPITGLDWTTIAAWVAGAVVIASVLEYLRPYVPHENRYQPEDTSRLEMEIGAFVEEGKPWAYWESQNPVWINWIVITSVAYMLILAYQSYAEAPWVAVMLALFAASLALVYGGLRVMVTPDRLRVGLGVFGIPLLKVRLADIVNVEVHEFSPFREFGGYGIRFNRRMKAYFFRGNRGVLLTAQSGKKYLVGSDHPERLAAVLDMARKMAGN